MRHVWLWVVLIGVALPVRPEIVFKPREYKQEQTVLEGLWVYEDALKVKRPSVLLVHQWKGLGEYEKKRAEMLAKLGYNVFAVDIYGKGVRPNNAKDAAAEAAKYKENRALLKARVNAGLAELKKLEFTDSKKIAAI